MIEVEPVKKRIHLGNCVVDEGTIALTGVDLAFSDGEKEITLYEGTPVVLAGIDKKGYLRITDYEEREYHTGFLTYFANSFLPIDENDIKLLLGDKKELKKQKTKKILHYGSLALFDALVLIGVVFFFKQTNLDIGLFTLLFTVSVLFALLVNIFVLGKVKKGIYHKSGLTVKCFWENKEENIKELKTILKKKGELYE